MDVSFPLPLRAGRIPFGFFWFLCFLLMMSSPQVFSQPEYLETDKVFSLSELYSLMRNHHPLAKQADLIPESAKQELREAKGGFDPKIDLRYDRKEFDEKVYFNLVDTELKVPVWAGEIKAAFVQNHGQFLNPENFVDDPNGQTLIGISLPIAKGLLIDQRRAMIRKARLMQDLAVYERIKVLNKLFLQASKAYYDWFFYDQQYRLIVEAYNLANLRFNGVKRRIQLGEVAAIDSVKARTLLQERNIQKMQAALELKNSRLLLSNYLWGENETPLELRENVRPEGLDYITFSELNADQLLLSVRQNHPEIRKLQLKGQQLDIDQRLGKNNLLPDIRLNYTLYSNVDDRSETTTFDFNQNYRFGFSFLFPIFLRKERAKLQKTQIKQLSNQQDLLSTIRKVENEVSQAYNQLGNLLSLFDAQRLIIENYRLLRDAEIRKFRNGESSLFLINTRDNDLVNGQVKLLSFQSKYLKSQIELLHSVGQIFW